MHYPKSSLVKVAARYPGSQLVPVVEWARRVPQTGPSDAADRSVGSDERW